MLNYEQGVLKQSRFRKRLSYVLLLAVLTFSSVLFANPPLKNHVNQDKTSSENTIEKRVVVLHNEKSALQNKLNEYLQTYLNTAADNPEKNNQSFIAPIISGRQYPVLVIAIGQANIALAKSLYPEADKLFISSDPATYHPDSPPGIHTTVLYMAQPYCRQIQFISLLNPDWNTISYLYTNEKPVNASEIESCASQNNLNTYPVAVTQKETFSHDIKNALKHSDLLLALPDKKIYNSNTVKNILLTSYRFRKPVIAFSRNFVNAGALASIHSDEKQIAATAIDIISDYLKSDGHFKHTANYPLDFNISINKQVFRALDIDTPDLDRIKMAIDTSTTGTSGRQQ